MTPLLFECCGPGARTKGEATVGETHTKDDAVVRDIRGPVGELTEDEVALVRTLTPPDLTQAAMVEHLVDLVDLVATIRSEEAVADYVYAIAPSWDGTIETLLLGGRVTAAFNRHELESCGAELVAPECRAPAQRARSHRVPEPVA
jgi:hypothetical protein